MARSAKSTPVTLAPSRAQESVSRPKWHPFADDVSYLLDLDRIERQAARARNASTL